MNTSTHSELSLPKSFQKGGQVYLFNRENRYPRSKFTAFELNEEGDFSHAQNVEIRKPTRKEIKQINPRELVEEFVYIMWIILGALVPATLTYFVFGIGGAIGFGFGGLVFAIFALAFVTEFTTESRYIIISKDESVMLLEKGENRLLFYVVDGNRNPLYSIHLKGDVGQKTLQAHRDPYDISNSIRISKVNHEMAHKEVILVRKEHFITVTVMIDGEEFCELVYADGAINNNIYAKISGKILDPVKLAIAITLIQRIWTIPEPMGVGG